MTKQAKMKKRFFWTDGCRLSIDAQASGEELERLQPHSAEQVLSAACKRSSPLHRAFDWDDASAAHEHRLSTARLILRSLRYEVRLTPSGPMRVCRYFVGLNSQPKEERYVTFARIMSDKDLRAEMLDQLKRELKSFAERNADFRGERALKEVFRAIDKL